MGDLLLDWEFDFLGSLIVRLSWFDIFVCSLIKKKKKKKLKYLLSRKRFVFFFFFKDSYYLMDFVLVLFLDSFKKKLFDFVFTCGRFEGAAPEPRKGIRSGHVPGSKCIPFAQVKNNVKIHLIINTQKSI